MPIDFVMAGAGASAGMRSISLGCGVLSTVQRSKERSQAGSQRREVVIGKAACQLAIVGAGVVHQLLERRSPCLGEDQVRRYLVVGVVLESGKPLAHKQVGHALDVLASHSKAPRELRHRVLTARRRAQYLPPRLTLP